MILICVLKSDFPAPEKLCNLIVLTPFFGNIGKSSIKIMFHLTWDSIVVVRCIFIAIFYDAFEEDVM